MLWRDWAIVLLILVQGLSFIRSSIIPRPRPFNLTSFFYPRVTSVSEAQLTPQPPHFLQNVLDAIIEKEKWELEDIRVTELKVRKVKYETVRRYEFRLRLKKSEIILKMYDQPSEWKKLVVLTKNGSSNFESTVKKIGSKAVIDSFKIEGPLELQVIGDNDQLSITLPLNESHTGLRRILVGEGITLEVKGAEEISIFHPSILRRPQYGMFQYKRRNEVGSHWLDSCTALPAIHVLGSASAVAYVKQRPAACIKTIFSSNDAVRLLSEKCYIWPDYERQKHLLSDLTMRIGFLERVLRNFLNVKVNSPNPLGTLKTKIRASTIFRFHLELERDIKSNDTFWNSFAEWRTRPTSERVWFEVAARIEDEVLKPIVIKRIRPVDTESFSWNSLLSNLSFTKFPSMLVPPEPLTLDVKW